MANLIAYWGFNEGAGTVVQDGSGNNNAGTISGATWSTRGRFGSALNFQNGTAHVTIPNTPALGQLTNRLTLAAWVFPTSSANPYATIIQRNNAAHTFFNFLLYARWPYSSGGPAFRINWNNDTAINTGESVRSSITLPLFQWSHVAATYDGVTLQIYINGALRGSTSLLNGTIPASSQPIWIGANDLNGNPFRGRIDEVRIYNRALSQNEIQSIMTAVTP